MSGRPTCQKCNRKYHQRKTKEALERKGWGVVSTDWMTGTSWEILLGIVAGALGATNPLGAGLGLALTLKGAWDYAKADNKKRFYFAVWNDIGTNKSNGKFCFNCACDVHKGLL